MLLLQHAAAGRAVALRERNDKRIDIDLEGCAVDVASSQLLLIKTERVSCGAS